MAEQEPEGPGHALLTEWGLHTRGGFPGGAKSWSVHERLDPTHGDEPPDRVIAVDKIVAKIGTEFPPYRRMVLRFYLDELAYWEVALRLKYTIEFVKMSLQAVCDLVDRRLQEVDEGKPAT